MLAFSTHVLEFPRLLDGAWGRSVWAWLHDRWRDILVVGILVPTFLGGGALLINIVERLASLEKGQADIVRRIDGIASALPDIRVKVAYEAIYGPISSAVLVSEPSQDVEGSWGSMFGC